MKKNYFLKFAGLFFIALLAGYNGQASTTTDGLNPITTIIDKSQATGNLPSIIDNSGNNRGAGFNSENVFVASRQNGNHVYYWDISNPAADPMELDITGVSGGTFTLSDLTVVGNHIFASNMVFAGGEFKVYHWEGKSALPSVLLSYINAPARLGDAFTVLGNPEESAMLIASGHGTNNFYIWQIVNGQIPNNEPTVYTFANILNANFGRITKVPGEDLYLASGSGFGLLLLDNQMNILAEIPSGFFPYWSMYPYIFYYEGQRFLTYQHVKNPPAENVMYVLDINQGATVVEALQSLAQSTFAERVVHSIDLGSIANGNASVSLDIINDAAGNVWTLAYSAGNGFVVQKYGDASGTGVRPTPLVSSNVFPNPASRNFTFTSENTIQQIVFYDITGSVIKTIRVDSNHITIDTESFSNGIYLIQILTETGVSTAKLLIQK